MFPLADLLKKISLVCPRRRSARGKAFEDTDRSHELPARRFRVATLALAFSDVVKIALPPIKETFMEPLVLNTDDASPHPDLMI